MRMTEYNHTAYSKDGETWRNVIRVLVMIEACLVMKRKCCNMTLQDITRQLSDVGRLMMRKDDCRSKKESESVD